jgi:acetoin utilization protein AcuC
VLTISLHEHPSTLFPGTGLPSETGAGDAAGTSVNVALRAGTGDAGWLRALDAVVPPLIRAFRPDVLVSQHGCDSHRLDPLAHLDLSLDAQRRAQSMLAGHRRRRVRAGTGGAQVLDASAGRGGRPAHRPVHTDPRALARICSGQNG